MIFYFKFFGKVNVTLCHFVAEWEIFTAVHKVFFLTPYVECALKIVAVTGFCLKLTENIRHSRPLSR